MTIQIPVWINDPEIFLAKLQIGSGLDAPECVPAGSHIALQEYGLTFLKTNYICASTVDRERAI